MGPIALRLGGKALLCQIIIAILWVPTYVPANPVIQAGVESPGDNTTCREPECRKMSRMIRRQMGNETPCDDFYNYVCGNWKGDNELKPTILKEKAVITLADLLKKAWEPSQVSNTTMKLISAYYSCTKMGKDQDALEASIINVISRYNVTNKTWPIIGEMEKKPARKESDDYLEVLKKTGPRPVFSYSISKKNGTPVILMTKPNNFYVFDDGESASAIQSDAEVTSDSTVYDYKHYDDLLAEEEKAYKKFLTRTMTLLNELLSHTEAKIVAEDIVQMEKGLSKLASAAKEAGTQKMNLSQLGKLLDKAFPMTEILQKDFEGLDIKITEETEVWVDYIDYFKNAVIFLKCNTMETLSNYIFWTKIREMAEAEGTLLHKLYLKYKNKTSVLNFTEVGDSYEAGRAGKPSNLSLRCVRQLLEHDVMYTAGANYYITAKFNKTSKNDVLTMMEFVNYSFIDVVQNNTWMSKRTKEAVMTKLKTMATIIGYPDWMLNDTIIEALYQFIPQIPKNASFVEHYHYALENNHKQSLLQMKPGRYFKKPNEDIPLRSHAYYVERTNTAVYPAAAIVTHYRSSPIPRSVNYGTIGTIIAQLLTKLIDRYDDLSKETGRYNKNTWDNETRDNFCNMSSCLNNTEECNDTWVYRSHRHEKLHDYLGVRISYQAMRNSQDYYTPPFLLPGKKLNTENKIFFTMFGSLYCPYSINEKRIQSRMDDGNKFPNSLNEIVYTFEEFNKTFSCNVTVGADTCHLMPPKEPKNPVGC